MTTNSETPDNTLSCSVCQKRFIPKFGYQVREEGSGLVAVCSTVCHQRSLSDGACCDVCGKSFKLEFPFQVAMHAGEKRQYCSLDCRDKLRSSFSSVKKAAPKSNFRRIAVFNHKGGTGKTTTSVNLAAGLAETGRRVLLVDVDGQGNVGASLGIRGEKTLYHVLVHRCDVREAVVPVRDNLDVLTSDASLAAAELSIAQKRNRHRLLRDSLASVSDDYDVVILDCAPALSVLNQNALAFADGVIVPVGCDYLSLVGVKQVLKTLKDVSRLLKHDPKIIGVLPTFYDARTKIARDAVETLRAHFKDVCLEPIRINTKLREAPSARKTIFEYAPDSHGAADYARAVTQLIERDPTATGVAGVVRRRFEKPKASMGQTIQASA